MGGKGDFLRKGGHLVPVIGSVGSKTSAPTVATSTRSSKKLKSRQNSVKSMNFKTINYTDRPQTAIMIYGQSPNNSARREMAHQ